jgi:hypothetical protein
MARPIIKVRSAGRESYKFYKEKNPQSKITFTQWKKVIYAYNEALIEHVLETGDKIKLSWGLGTLTVGKKKQKPFHELDGEKKITLAVDWPQSKTLGYKVFILNGHTDGYRYKWYWFPKEARFAKSCIWTFKPCRKASRLLASYIKQEGTEYKHLYRTFIRI